MSSFNCETCGSAIVDTPTGYVTGCQHYPIDTPSIRQRIRNIERTLLYVHETQPQLERELQDLRAEVERREGQ